MTTKWHITGDYVLACNCDYGCPCNFNARPTMGFCQGAVGFQVSDGVYGDVRLDAQKAFVVAKWPGAIHEGNGALALFIDGNEEQQQALVPILTAEDPGLPWEILASTFTDIHGPFFEPIEFTEVDGSPHVRVGDKVEVAWQAFTNPVTGERHEPHMVLKEGFIFQDGLIGTTSTLRVDADGVTMEHPNKNSYLADVEWSSENRLAAA